MEKYEEGKQPTIDIIFDKEIICSQETGDCDLQIPFSFGAVKYDNHETQPTTFVGAYDRYYDLIFELSIKGFSALLALDSPDFKLNIFGSTDDIQLFSINSSLNPSSEASIISLPNKSPSFLQFNKRATHATAYLLNGPNTYLSKPLALETNKFCFTLIQSNDAHGYFRNKRQHKHDFLITHYIEIKPKLNNEFSAPDLSSELNILTRFLTFAKGADVSVGHLVGHTKKNDCSFLGLGFSKCDQFHHQTKWLGNEVIKHLPAMFTLFQKAIVKKNVEGILTRTIEYYRASSVSRSYSAETAIITSFAALETIVPYILKVHGGWSNAIIGERISFHDKLRAAVSVIGITSDPLLHGKNLHKRSKDFGNVDAYELLSIFRNRIVHQGKQFKYSAYDIHEAWLLSQWLCEIFIFFIIEYRGPIYESRQIGGWKGPAIPIPLK